VRNRYVSLFFYAGLAARYESVRISEEIRGSLPERIGRLRMVIPTSRKVYMMNRDLEGRWMDLNAHETGVKSPIDGKRQSNGFQKGAEPNPHHALLRSERAEVR
jgi:hypothetical protein